MTATSTTFDDGCGQSRAQRSIRGRATPHRVTVLAGDAADVVTAAGGLIFDRASAGWVVEVYLPEPADQRPFHILGTDARELSDGFATATEWPDAIVVAARLYERDVRVRKHFAAASRQQRTEVAIWGGDWPTGLKPGIGRVEHRLSAAAQAFKVHAMEAAGVSPRSTPSESFRSGKRRFPIAAPLLPPS